MALEYLGFSKLQGTVQDDRRNASGQNDQTSVQIMKSKTKK